MALQYDLIRLGLSLEDLGTEALSWYDLLTLVRHLQTAPESALAKEIHGFAPWSLEAQLSAIVADQLAIANWQRAGKKNAPKPKPLERPWLKPQHTKLGKDPIPVADFDAWWDSFGA